MDLPLAFRIAVAVGLGMLLGLERQRSQVREEALFGGVRTFALIAQLGAITAFLQDTLDLSWLVAVAFAAVALLVIVSYAITAQRGDVGITTEVTALLTFLLGPLCVWGHVGLAAALAVTGTLLLSLRDWLHRLAERIETADVEATLKFAIITLIILPLLPNRNFGPPPLDVINPYKVWLMVVLIAGLNFIGYILVKVIGKEHGLGLTGLLGGLVSSTAVTLGFSQRSTREPALAPALALGILLSWTAMFFRVMIAVGVVNPALAGRLAWGVGLMGIVSLLLSLYLRQRTRIRETGTVASGHKPFELGEAIKFGLLFGVFIFAAKAAEVYLGDAGLYLAGALAGITDVDAISLSMANLSASNPAGLGTAARTVVIAVMSNTLVKSAMIVLAAAPTLRRVMLPSIGLLLAAGAAGAFLVG